MRRRWLIPLFLILLLWGFLDGPASRRPNWPPSGSGSEFPSLDLRVLDLVSGRPIADARLVLGSPGGRVSEARSAPDGEARLAFFPVEDYLFRLRVEALGFESADLRLRGAGLEVGELTDLLLVPVGGRARIRGQIAAGEALREPPRLLLDWRVPRPGLRPGGRRLELEMSGPGPWDFEFPGLPIGAEFELACGARLQSSGQTGAAGLVLRGPIAEDGVDLGRLEFAHQVVEGRLLDHQGRPLAEEQLGLRLEGFTASPLIRATTDRWGRYAILVPRGPGSIRGRASVGSSATRLVELVWEASGEIARDLRCPQPIPGS